MTVRHCTLLCCLIVLLASACGVAGRPTPTPLPASAVEQIIIISRGEQEVIEGDDERFTTLAEHLLATVPTFNLPAECAVDEHTVQALRQQERLVELTFLAAQEVTLGEWVAEEDRDRIPTDERGFRIVETETLLLPLSGQYRGHLLVPSEGQAGPWGCWAVERRNEIDTQWVEATEAILASQEPAQP
jgi:hypothetical protein